MARYKALDTSPRFLAVDLETPLLPGSFEHVVHHLLGHEVDLSLFDTRYRNDQSGDGLSAGDAAQAHSLCLRRGVVSSRGKNWRITGSGSKKRGGEHLDLKWPERPALRIPRSTGKKPENENGADQACTISLSEIGPKKGFSTASTRRCVPTHRAIAEGPGQVSSPPL